MGYTHYFGLKTKHKRTGLATLKKQVDDVLNEHKDIIQYESDIYNPAYCHVENNEILISFNGIGNEGHETFYFNSAEPDFEDCCKTARKPYDKVVCKVLVLLFNFYGSRAFDLGSDGFSNSQPKDRYYHVGSIARPTIIDGCWGNVVMWFNAQFKRQLKFKVDGVHGHLNCYFHCKLA